MYTKVLVWGGPPPRQGNYGASTEIVINIAVLINMITYVAMDMKLIPAITPVKGMKKVELTPFEAAEGNPTLLHARRLPMTLMTVRPREIGCSSSSASPVSSSGQMRADLWDIVCTGLPGVPRPRSAEP